MGSSVIRHSGRRYQAGLCFSASPPILRQCRGFQPAMEVPMARWLLALALVTLLATPASAQEDPPPPPGGWPADIPCGWMESLLFHVHAHLAIYVDGHPQDVPMGIGIG